MHVKITVREDPDQTASSVLFDYTFFANWCSKFLNIYRNIENPIHFDYIAMNIFTEKKRHLVVICY